MSLKFVETPQSISGELMKFGKDGIYKKTKVVVNSEHIAIGSAIFTKNYPICDLKRIYSFRHNIFIITTLKKKGTNDLKHIQLKVQDAFTRDRWVQRIVSLMENSMRKGDFTHANFANVQAKRLPVPDGLGQNLDRKAFGRSRASSSIGDKNRLSRRGTVTSFMSNMLRSSRTNSLNQEKKKSLQKKKSIINTMNSEYESRSMCLFHEWIWIDNVKNANDFATQDRRYLLLSELESLEWSGSSSDEFELLFGAHDVYRRYLIKMSSPEEVKVWIDLLTPFIPRRLGSRSSDHSVPTVDRLPTILYGWVEKRGERRTKTWRPRWLVLDRVQRTLSWFSSEEMNSASCVMWLSTDTTVVDGREHSAFTEKAHGFWILGCAKSSRRNRGSGLFFNCSCESEKNVWISALRRVAAGEVTTRARHFRFRGNLRRMMKSPHVAEILKEQGIESVELSPPREIYLWQKKQVKPTNHSTHRGRPSLLDMMNQESKRSVISCLWADPDSPLDAVHYIAKEDEDAKTWVKQLRSKLGIDENDEDDGKGNVEVHREDGTRYDVKRQDLNFLRRLIGRNVSLDEADPWYFVAKRFREAPYSNGYDDRAEKVRRLVCAKYGENVINKKNILQFRRLAVRRGRRRSLLVVDGSKDSENNVPRMIELNSTMIAHADSENSVLARWAKNKLSAIESERSHPMSIFEILRLLDSDCRNCGARKFAAERVASPVYFEDEIVRQCLPQLVQALKYEVHRKSKISELARALITRAQKNVCVASQLAWLLVVEAEMPKEQLDDLTSEVVNLLEESDELWESGNKEECVTKFVEFAKAHSEDDPRFPAALGDIQGDTDIDRRRYAIRTVFRAIRKQPYDPLQGAWWWNGWNEKQREIEEENKEEESSKMTSKTSDEVKEKRSREEWEYLLGYLKRPTNGWQMFRQCLLYMLENYESIPEINTAIKAQRALVVKLNDLNRKVMDAPGNDTASKRAALRNLLVTSERSWTGCLQSFPFYPNLELSHVNGDRCTVFKSNVRPIGITFCVKLEDDEEEDEESRKRLTLRKRRKSMSKKKSGNDMERIDCGTRRAALRKAMMLDVKMNPPSWIADIVQQLVEQEEDERNQVLESILPPPPPDGTADDDGEDDGDDRLSSPMISTRPTRRKSKALAGFRETWRDMVGSVMTSCAKYNKWGPEERSFVASKHNISLQQSEELFRYICGETSVRIEQERYKKVSNESSPQNLSVSTASIASVSSPRTLPSIPKRTFQGALWKKPRSGSGKPSLRQVVLTHDRLEYSSNKMEGEDFRVIQLSDIADVNILKNDRKTFVISFQSGTAPLTFSSESMLKTQEWVTRLSVYANLKNISSLKQTFSTLNLKTQSTNFDESKTSNDTPSSGGGGLSTQRVSIRVTSMQDLDPDRLIDIRRVAKSMGISTTRVWSKNVTLHFKATCKEKEQSERPKPYTAFRNKGKNEDIGSFEFEFSSRKEHPDPSTNTSLTLYANVSTDRSSFPIMVPLGECEIPLKDIWNSTTKAIKIVLRRNPKWLYLRVQSALSSACDLNALQDVWKEFSDTLISLPLPESTYAKKNKARWANFRRAKDTSSTSVSPMKSLLGTMSTVHSVEYAASPLDRDESLKQAVLEAQSSSVSTAPTIKEQMVPKCSDLDILDHAAPATPETPMSMSSDVDILPTRVSPTAKTKGSCSPLLKKSSVESTTSSLQKEIKGVLIVSTGRGMSRKSGAAVNLFPSEDWIPRVEKVVRRAIRNAIKTSNKRDNKEVEDEIAEWSLEVIQRHANGDLTQEIGPLFNQQNDDNVDTKKRKSSEPSVYVELAQEIDKLDNIDLRESPWMQYAIEIDISDGKISVNSTALISLRRMPERQLVNMQKRDANNISNKSLPDWLGGDTDDAFSDALNMLDSVSSKQNLVEGNSSNRSLRKSFRSSGGYGPRYVDAHLEESRPLFRNRAALMKKKKQKKKSSLFSSSRTMSFRIENFNLEESIEQKFSRRLRMVLLSEHEVLARWKEGPKVSNAPSTPISEKTEDSIEASMEISADHSSWQPTANARNPLNLDGDLENVSVIFKKGDDVRQDMLVLQLIEIMDKWIRAEGLDLGLTAYRTLATRSDAGLIEVVPGCKTMSNIKEEHGTIAQFLQDCGGHIGTLATEPLETCSRTLAGYAVVTYVLGIGDRHFDNILVQDTGRFVHIDFGWAFGYDPKDFTGLKSEIRFNKDMMAVLGGADSEMYKRFERWTCDAYVILRKHAAEIETVLNIMQDAGLEHLNASSIPKIRKNLCLWMTPEEARNHMRSVLERCRKSVGQDVLEYGHRVAIAVKN